MAETEHDLIKRRALGWSIACDAVESGMVERDIRLVPGPNGTDFARVEGDQNLAQSLSIALTTALGGDVFNTSFGFDGLNALTDDSSAFLVRERVRIAVVKLLTKDPRVRRIIDVTLDDGRMTSGRILSVTVAFETIAGEQATVAIGKVVTSG
jgi:phage baseplate assembly protein W